MASYGISTENPGTRPWRISEWGMTIKRNKSRGFSLIELLVVIAIMLAVSAMAMPYFVTYISNYRLRGALSDAAGFLQRMRIEAVRHNAALQISTGTRDSRSIAWVDLPGGTANAWDSGEPYVELPKNIDVVNSGYPGNATTGLGYTTQNPSSAVIRFNARGLPCVYVSGGTVCENNDGSNQVGFVLYMKNSGSIGAASWGAVTITPAGRVQTWTWNGTSYSGQ